MRRPSRPACRRFAIARANGGRYNEFVTTISVHEIQRDPLGILRRVEEGETLLIVRDEQPVAEIKPAPAQARHQRPYGLCAGKFTVPGDFDQPLPETIIREFEGA